MIKKTILLSLFGALFSSQAFALPSNTFVFREPLKHVKVSKHVSNDEEDSNNNNNVVDRDNYDDGFFDNDDEGGEPSDIDYLYSVSINRGLGGLKGDERGMSGSTTGNGKCSVDIQVDTLPVSADSIIVRYSTDFGALSKTKQVVYKGHNRVIADKVKLASDRPGVANVKVWQEGGEEVFERKVYFYEAYNPDNTRYDDKNYVEVYEHKEPYTNAQTIMTRAFWDGLEVSPSNIIKGSPFAESSTTEGVRDARQLALQEGVQLAFDINQISRYKAVSAYTDDCGRQRSKW